MSKLSPAEVDTNEAAGAGSNVRSRTAYIITLPKVYGYLTVVQAGTAVVFSTFLVTHLSAPTLAAIGGVDLTNRAIVLGRVYYQNKLLEPLVVFGALVGHIAAGIAKRGIRLYWVHKEKQDPKKLACEVNEKVETIKQDDTDEQGAKRTKTINKTTITFTASYISKALSSLLPNHHSIGYILIPLVFGHAYVNRFLPKRHFGDSSLVNISYVTLSLRKWPRSSYLYLTALIGLAIYHATSGAPVVYRILRGYILKMLKGGEKIPESSPTKNYQRILRNGVIITSIGLLTTGLLVIGGKLGNDPRIPLRTEYLKVYGRVYPQSWVRY